MNDIDKARKDGDKVYNKFTEEEIRFVRRKAKTNLFFLAHSILGYTKLVNLHLDFCKWLKATSAEQYRLKLLPRSHYKSTVDTISDSLQVVLPDDFKDQPYPRNLGPDCRLLISHETSEAASRFLNSITQHFTVNPLLMGLFPECVPNPKEQRINKLELELPRNSIWGEPTIDTVGVAGKSQGRHYNIIKCDDIYGAAARDSKAERESTILWVDNLQSLLISPRTDHIDFIGTRWAHDDIYSHIKKQYGSNLKEYTRSVEEVNPVTNNKETIFPEEFNSKSLDILRKNPIVWNAQYVNNPFEGGSKFDSNWIKFYNYGKGLGKTRQLIRFDPTQGADPIKCEVGELDICFLIDPAMVGNAGFIITGTDSKMNIFILEAIKKSWRPPELVDLLFKKVMEYRPRLVAIEEVLFSGLFQHWIQREMILRNVKFRVIPVKTHGRKKEARIEGLANYYASGQIYFNQSQEDLIREFYEFGATEDIHLHDALAYGPEVWRASINTGRLERMREVEMEISSHRDMATGYGKYK